MADIILVNNVIERWTGRTIEDILEIVRTGVEQHTRWRRNQQETPDCLTPPSDDSRSNSPGEPQTIELVTSPSEAAPVGGRPDSPSEATAEEEQPRLGEESESESDDEEDDEAYMQRTLAGVLCFEAKRKIHTDARNTLPELEGNGRIATASGGGQGRERRYSCREDEDEDEGADLEDIAEDEDEEDNVFPEDYSEYSTPREDLDATPRAGTAEYSHLDQLPPGAGPSSRVPDSLVYSTRSSVVQRVSPSHEETFPSSGSVPRSTMRPLTMGQPSASSSSSDTLPTSQGQERTSPVVRRGSLSSARPLVTVPERSATSNLSSSRSPRQRSTSASDSPSPQEPLSTLVRAPSPVFRNVTMSPEMRRMVYDENPQSSSQRAPLSPDRRSTLSQPLEEMSTSSRTSPAQRVSPSSRGVSPSPPRRASPCPVRPHDPPLFTYPSSSSQASTSSGHTSRFASHPIIPFSEASRPSGQPSTSSSQSPGERSKSSTPSPSSSVGPGASRPPKPPRAPRTPVPSPTSGFSRLPSEPSPSASGICSRTTAHRPRPTTLPTSPSQRSPSAPGRAGTPYTVPSTSIGQPSSSSQQSSTPSSEQPTTPSSQEPSTPSSQQPSTSSSQRPPTSSSQQPPTSSSQQPSASSSQQPSTSSSQPAASSDPPEFASAMERLEWEQQQLRASLPVTEDWSDPDDPEANRLQLCQFIDAHSDVALPRVRTFAICENAESVESGSTGSARSDDSTNTVQTCIHRPNRPGPQEASVSDSQAVSTEEEQDQKDEEEVESDSLEGEGVHHRRSPRNDDRDSPPAGNAGASGGAQRSSYSSTDRQGESGRRGQGTSSSGNPSQDGGSQSEPAAHTSDFEAGTTLDGVVEVPRMLSPRDTSVRTEDHHGRSNRKRALQAVTSSGSGTATESSGVGHSSSDDDGDGPRQPPQPNSEIA